MYTTELLPHCNIVRTKKRRLNKKYVYYVNFFLGFNEPDAYITKARTTHLVRKQRQIDAEEKGTKQKIPKRNDAKVKKHTKEKQSKTKSIILFIYI